MRTLYTVPGPLLSKKKRYPSFFDHSGQPGLPETRSLHFSVVASYNISFLESIEFATIYRPVGDKRGPNMPSDPGTTEIWWLLKSITRIVAWASSPRPPKTILVPSGDQFGSACWIVSSRSTGRGVAPSAAITYILATWPALSS